MLNIPNESLQDYVQHIGSLCNILNRRSNIPFPLSSSPSRGGLGDAIGSSQVKVRIKTEKEKALGSGAVSA